MRQILLAEFCGRWGCTWQEGIINVILASLDGKSALILLGLLLTPILLVVLMLLGGLITFYDFILSLGRARQNLNNLGNFRQKGKRILSTVKLLGGTLIVAYKAITGYQQQQNIKNQACERQQVSHEPDETAINSFSNEAVNNSAKSQLQRKHILTTARFLGRTVRNIAKD